ncbi:DinB family protein [Nocardia veterana]|uniref:DinB family protein n=1 Tax=Nocardia veterana TaxID=132249 RepID=A0A7X6M563_9NOCA|nr:DinB family protein [Nocardia veterana]NKY89397.1 DinB family protein [Nocardia veterana]
MTQANGTEAATDTLTGERAALLAVLRKQRHFLRFTTRDLTDAQAAHRSTVSELCLGGLIKHVASVERTWADFITEGASSHKNFADMTEADFQQRADEFRMLPGETLAGVLEAYDEVARRTDAMIAGPIDLDATWPLPEAPWFQEREWSTRQVLLHIIAETAQHSGHADIIREAIDGTKTMG